MKKIPDRLDSGVMMKCDDGIPCLQADRIVSLMGLVLGCKADQRYQLDVCDQMLMKNQEMMSEIFAQWTAALMEMSNQSCSWYEAVPNLCSKICVLEKE